MAKPVFVTHTTLFRIDNEDPITTAYNELKRETLKHPDLSRPGVVWGLSIPNVGEKDPRFPVKIFAEDQNAFSFDLSPGLLASLAILIGLIAYSLFG